MTDDLNIHRHSVEGQRLDHSHDGRMQMKLAPDVQIGDFIVTPTFCGVVSAIDSFDGDGYGGLLRLYTSVGGVIRARFEYVAVIVRPPLSIPPTPIIPPHG